MRSLLKKYFIAGALVLVPVAVTVWVLQILILWGEGIFQTLVPLSFRPITLLGFEIPGLGLLFTLLLILVTGALTRLYFGRKLIAFGDWILERIPLGRSIYIAIKKLLNTICEPSLKEMRQVVLVHFPSPGNHMIGFVTGESVEEIQKKLNQKTVNVFVPTTPNPTSGFLFVIPREQLIPVDLPVEKAFKLIVSGGTTS